MVCLEDIWTDPSAAGLELVWTAQRQWTRTRLGEGGTYSSPQGTALPIARRSAEPMLPAAVLRTRHVQVLSRGGVTLSSGEQVRGAALATSVDVEQLRFPETATVREVDCDVRSAVLLAQPGDQVFGHQLLDVLPRIVLTAQVLPADTPFLISMEAHDSLRRLLDELGLQHLTLHALDPDPSTATHVDELYLVTGARQNNRFDPERIAEMVDVFRPEAATGGPSRLFLTRSQLPEGRQSWRRLTNRREVEGVFADAGYAIEAPEKLGLRATAALVAGADTLAGEDGSAMHNVLWGAKKLLCLGHEGAVDTLHLRLCDALGVEFTHVAGSTGDVESESDLYFRDRSWSLSIPWLREKLDLSPASRPARAASSAWHLTECFWGAGDRSRFAAELEALVVKHFGEKTTLFAGDNLVTIGRNLSLLQDEAFLSAFASIISPDNYVGQGIIWRLYTFAWAARSCLQLEGDFVECGVSTGTSSKIMCEYVRFETVPKKLYLFDVFGAHEKLETTAYFGEQHSVLDEVRQRFAPYPNVELVPGFIPDVFEDGRPERIAFLHIDLNNVDAEIAVLEALFDAVVPEGSSSSTTTAPPASRGRRRPRTPGSATAATWCLSCRPVRDLS